MNFIDKYLIKLSSKFVGSDEYGNKYYLGSKTNYLGKKKRYVIYNGLDQTTKVPPMWHAWLHYLATEKELPLKSNIKEQQQDWQPEYKPNLSGTKWAYDPKKAKHRIMDHYKAWNG